MTSCTEKSHHNSRAQSAALNELQRVWVHSRLPFCSEMEKHHLTTEFNLPISTLEGINMKIDIWSDIICPFCYIGKRKLELALEQTGIDAVIEWRSFELDPAAPRSFGAPLPDVLQKMYGFNKSQAIGMLMHEELDARRVGLDFQWRIAKPGNTFDAHRLVHLAKQHGIGGEVKERFFRAFFTEGQDIGDQQILRALAIEAGLVAEEVDAVLAGDRFTDEVRADEQAAKEREISGVPYYLINGQVALPGARRVEEFVQVLREQQAQLTPQSTSGEPQDSASAEAGMCKDGVCAIR